MLSTLPAEIEVEIKLTFAVHFLSVFSPFTVSDLETLDSALERKKAKLHIWVNPSVLSRLSEICAALEKQFPKLRDQQRLYVYSLKGRQTECRHWLHQQQA